MNEKLQVTGPGAWNTAGALGMFQLLMSSWRDGLAQEVPLKNPDQNLATMTIPLWKVYNSKAKSLQEVLDDIKKNGHQLNTSRLQNIHELFWVPWNQVVIAAEVLMKRKSGSKPLLNEKQKSKKIWGPWGDMSLYRKQTGGTNNTRMGVLTKVNVNTVMKAVNILNPLQQTIPWQSYVRWAIGEKDKFDGALVDEGLEYKRPNSESEEPKDKTNPEAMAYRNYYDVLAWCYAPKVEEKLKSINDPNKGNWNVNRYCRTWYSPSFLF